MTDPDDVLAFIPVLLARVRARGWSTDRQRAFIAMLARCGVVAHAARSVGMSARSAYQLRERTGADSFAAAWDWAIEMGLDAARDAAMAQITAAREQPLVRRGRVVGTRRGEDHRMIFAAMRAFSAEVNGRRADMPHRQRMAARDLWEKLSDPGPWDPDVPRPVETIEPDYDMKNPIGREKCEVKPRRPVAPPSIRRF